MKELDINGYKVSLDDEDYDRVAALKWWIHKSVLKERGRVYFYHSFLHQSGKKFNQSLQRFLLGLTLGDGLQGDHINGDTLDNRRCNLRICTIAENTRNQKTHKDNQTGYKGVRYNRTHDKYQAKICVNRKVIYLGTFSSPEEAHAAYCEASKKYHGEFGRTE